MVNVEREMLAATTHSAAEYTITFMADGGKLGSDGALTATLGCELPDCIPAPTRTGCLFRGWKTAAGIEYYDADGSKCFSSYGIPSNIVLYAQWQAVDCTATTPEPVPYSFIEAKCPAVLAEHGGDYEATAFAISQNGMNKVWECYVAGISPADATAEFKAKIEMRDGAPQVLWEPDLNTNGVIRTYKIYGSETLNNGGDWQYPTNSLHRFFKVIVEMP